MTKKHSTNQFKKEEVTFIGDEQEEEEDLTTLDEKDTSLSHAMRDKILIAKEQAKHPKMVEGKFTHDACYEALLFAHDQLERAFINFVLLGETAKQVKSMDNPILSLDFIHLGVLQKNLSLYGMSTIKTMLKKNNLNIGEEEITFECDDVPIKLEILTDDRFYTNPDTVFFYVVDLAIPNPFDKYIEMFDNKE